METALKPLDIRELLGVLIESDGAGGYQLRSAIKAIVSATSMEVSNDVGNPIPVSSATLASQATLASILAAAIAAIPAGENHIGAIGGNTEKLAVGVVTSATAYTANDNIGGILTLGNFLRVAGGTGILQGIQLWALANQKPNLYIDFWDAAPLGTYTNDLAQVIAGDHVKHLGFIEIAASDWKDTGVISRVALTGIGMVLKGSASRDIYMTIQDKTGVTFGSVAGLFIKVGILQD